MLTLTAKGDSSSCGTLGEEVLTVETTIGLGATAGGGVGAACGLGDGVAVGVLTLVAANADVLPIIENPHHPMKLLKLLL